MGSEMCIRDRYNTCHDQLLQGMIKTNECMRADPVPTGQAGLSLIRLARNGINHRLFPEMMQAEEILVPELRQRVKEEKGRCLKGRRGFSASFSLSETPLCSI